MTREERDYIDAKLRCGRITIQEVWVKTEDWTPEDAICEGIIKSITALLRIFERVKTEDEI